MKKVKGANILIIVIVCTLGLIIGALMYTTQAKINEEIIQATENEENTKGSFEIWTIEGALEQVICEEIDIYQKKYPDIHFTVKAFKNEIYKENLLNAARTNSLPDVFYTWGDRGLQELIELNAVRDITNEVEMNVKENMREDTLKNYTSNERIYGLPVFGWDTVLYCNTEIFNKCHLKLPETYQQLLGEVEILKDKGITPMAMGGDEAWMASLYYMELVLGETNIQSVERAANDPEYLTSTPFVRAAENFRRLVILRPWQTYYGEATQEEAINYFKQGKAAMMLSGSWTSSNLQRDMQGNMNDRIKVIPFPVDAQSGCYKGVAGYSDGFVLNTKSELKQESIVTLFLELMRDVSDNVVENKGVGFPVYKDQSIEDTNFELLKQCEKIFPTGHYHGAYDQIFSSEEIEKYDTQIKKLARGYITDQRFIRGITGQIE